MSGSFPKPRSAVPVLQPGLIKQACQQAYSKLSLGKVWSCAHPALASLWHTSGWKTWRPWIWVEIEMYQKADLKLLSYCNYSLCCGFSIPVVHNLNSENRVSSVLHTNPSHMGCVCVFTSLLWTNARAQGTEQGVQSYRIWQWCWFFCVIGVHGDGWEGFSQ